MQPSEPAGDSLKRASWDCNGSVASTQDLAVSTPAMKPRELAEHPRNGGFLMELKELDWSTTPVGVLGKTQ